jgi:hypothetical protein
MRWQTRLALAVGLLLVTGLPARPGEGNVDQEKAVALIKKLGGKAEVDEAARQAGGGRHPGGPDEPAQLHLTSTEVGDAGLAHLKGLYLGHTKIIGAGMAHPEGLTALESLSLRETAVDDAGLKHLHGLKALRSLKLGDTNVTAAGVKALLQALPKVTITN